jgi:prepilin-type N-terminal cleavage/methylation domain-containing protein
MKTNRMNRRGFNLIELVVVVVIIAIIGAIAIPQMSRGASSASDSALIQDLAILRSALDLYNAEHPNSPLTTSATFPDCLTKYSDASGTTSATKTTTAIYGPYLKTIPVLPVGTYKGQSAVLTSGGVGSASGGWYFTGTDFQANTPNTDMDSTGRQYNAY